MTIVKIFKHMHKKEWMLLIISCVLIVAQTFCDVIMPTYLGKLSEEISRTAAALSMSSILYNGGMMIMWAAVSFALCIVVRYLLNNLAANFSASLRDDLYQKILSFGDQEINKLSTSSLIIRTTLDINQIQFLFSQATYVLVKAPITAIWSICSIAAIEVAFTSGVIIIVSLIVLALIVVCVMVVPKIKRTQKLTDDINTAARESITGVRVIRAFNAEQYHKDRFNVTNNEITNANMFVNRSTGFLHPFITLGNNVMIIVLYWIASSIMMRASATSASNAVLIGNLSTFTQYAINIVSSFLTIVVVFILLPRAFVSMKRINEVFDTNCNVKYPSKGIEKEVNGDIEFKDVVFTYPNGGSPSLSNISFKIKSGEKFAIIGATGSSKTTVTKLLLRYYDIDSGSITLGDNDIKKLTEKELINHFSIAPQKAMLFKGTVKSNITYGDVYDEARFKKAVEIAQAQFIYNLEKGIDSPVSQGGSNFSGGQKQRLSLARAIYKKAKVMIFDDTFSALDFKTDMLVRKGINENLKDVTTITISQRIGSVKNSDQIMVLEHGKIVGLGKHDDLIKNCDTYKEIALSQLDREEL